MQHTRLRNGALKLIVEPIANDAIDRQRLDCRSTRIVEVIDPNRLSGARVMTDVAATVCRRYVLASLAVLSLLWFAAEATVAQSRTFRIFFDKNVTDLTPEAKKVIVQVKDFIKPSARVTITGICDTSEGEPDKLSLARAMEIQKELVALGIPPGVTLIISGKGTSQPYKATGPNVPEPYNRQAAITVN